MRRKRPPDPPPGEKRPVSRRPKNSPLALDGYWEMGDWDTQQRLKKDLRKLGVDTKALLDALRKDPDRATFQREQNAMAEYQMLCQAFDWKREWLGHWENIAREYKHLGLAPPPEVLRNVAEGKQAIRRIRRKGIQVDPWELAERRRAAAKGADRKWMHHQIPKAAAVGFARFTREVQKMYMGAVIRTTHRHLQPAIRTLQKEEGDNWSVKNSENRELDLKRRVSPRLNALISNFVRAFYPLWGYYVSPTVVRNTLRNAERKTKRAQALGSIRA